MPSYFLSETLKYLYLLFDENNFVHNRSYIFSTEAHLFDLLQLYTFRVRHDEGKEVKAEEEEERSGALTLPDENVYANVLNLQCVKPNLWDPPSSYNSHPFPFSFSFGADDSALHDRNVFINSLHVFQPVGLGLRRGQYCALDESASKTAFIMKKEVSASPQSLKSLGTTNFNNNHYQSQQQVADVHVPSLGRFKISLFSSGRSGEAAGYRVHRLEDDRVLEVSNVGEPALHLAEYHDREPGSLRNVIATSSVKVSCKVTIVIGDEEDGENRMNAVDKIWVEELLRRERYCAMSMFGATATAEKGLLEDILIVTGVEFLNGEDASACPPTQTFASPASSSPSEAIEPAEASNAGTHSLFKYLYSIASSTRGYRLNDPTTKEKDAVNYDSQRYENKIVVVRRGVCTFEDKAEFIQKQGAVAVIIENTEVSIFSFYL